MDSKTPQLYHGNKEIKSLMLQKIVDENKSKKKINV